MESQFLKEDATVQHAIVDDLYTISNKLAGILLDKLSSNLLPTSFQALGVAEAGIDFIIL